VEPGVWRQVVVDGCDSLFAELFFRSREPMFDG
jgi:hypothetical protein